mgnify:CR=1 FL=1
MIPLSHIWAPNASPVPLKVFFWSSIGAPNPQKQKTNEIAYECVLQAIAAAGTTIMSASEATGATATGAVGVVKMKHYGKNSNMNSRHTT